MTHSTSKLVGSARSIAHLTRRGLTLVEIMVVIAILGLLMGVIAFNVVGAADDADVEICKTQMSQIETTLNRYRATNKKLPNTAEGLEAAAKLFPDGSVPLDPWGNEFQYTSDGNDFELVSLGKDGESGGEDANADISSKDLKAEKAE